MNALYMDVVPHFPQHLFAVNAWNLRSVEAVQVHHTRMANGFVFEEAEYGRRVVFSGDTMPCKLLAERGAGADLLVHECTFEDGFEVSWKREIFLLFCHTELRLFIMFLGFIKNFNFL